MKLPVLLVLISSLSITASPDNVSSKKRFTYPLVARKINHITKQLFTLQNQIFTKLAVEKDDEEADRLSNEVIALDKITAKLIDVECSIANMPGNSLPNDHVMPLSKL